MRRVLTLLLTAALSLGMTSAAFAQSDEELSSTSVFPPDSPLFALQHVLDGWEELLALDDVTKAEVLAKIADNRLAEAAEMLAEGNEDVAADMIEQMQDALTKAADKLSKALEKIAAKNDDDEDDEDDEDSEEASGKEAAHEQVLERLEANLERHRTHLESVLDKLENENAREALERVLERRHGLENAMDKIRQQAEDDEDASAEEDEDSEDEEADEDDDDGPGDRPAGKGKPSKP